MDVVLDILDTFVFDKLYAFLLPAKSFGLLDQDSLLDYNRHINQYVTLSPSQYAVESSWSRDNIFRQFLSLFTTIWLVFNVPIQTSGDSTCLLTS
jgi:lathosterol oxidase